MSFSELFDPGMRHWRLEKDRQKDTIEIIPDPGPGLQPVKIDLEKMTATIDEQTMESVRAELEDSTVSANGKNDGIPNVDQEN
ncbi:MAG: hypothetical protein FWG47_00110 [Propionibacteriaceae bacterium]|nr:hypothetical protein [Propionibacteriaceae bacterium]